ncbi:unnamed protein product, partial [Ectocarpus sp. 4 AP-2014]
TKDQAAWLRFLPAMKRAQVKRASAASQCAQRMRSRFLETATDQGIQAFVSETHGLVSAGLMVSDSERHRQRIAELYREHVFPLDRLMIDLRRLGEQLDDELAVIDNELLIGLHADVDLDPTGVGCSPIDLAVLDETISKAIRKVNAEVDEAVARSATCIAVGTGVGFIGGGVAHEAMSDEAGNISPFGQLVASAIGLGAEMLASKVAEQTLQPGNELNRSVVDITTDLLAAVNPDGAVRTQIVQMCADSAIEHHERTTMALFRPLTVDADWAQQKYFDCFKSND